MSQRSEIFQKLKDLTDQILKDSDRAFEKKVTARARTTRKNLLELAKLCKEARKELLEIIHENKKKEE